MNVSRETQAKLDIYLELLKKWSSKINLVSASSLKDAARRHFEDSLQLGYLCPPGARSWVDLGSGGGFPGAVIAIVKPALEVTLIESDQRKAAFLRTVSRETNTPFNVIAYRIERADPQNADVVSARALAPLTDLLSFAEIHRAPQGTALFLKGATWQNEVVEARKKWRFTCKNHKSETSPDAALLEIGELSRV